MRQTFYGAKFEYDILRVVGQCSVIFSVTSNADGCQEGWKEGLQKLPAKCR